MRKGLILLTLFFLNSSLLFGQNKYFVYLKDKNNSTFKISEPEKFLSERSIKRRKSNLVATTTQDLPVNISYLDQISKTGAKIIGKSKWLNAVLVESSSSDILEKVKKLNFVKEIDGNKEIKKARFNAEAISNVQKNKFGVEENFEYGGSLNQIQQLGVDQMHKLDFTGKNILVAVFDAGFNDVPTLDAFKHLFSEKRIIKTYDFVSNDDNVYESHWHGTAALSCIAAKWPGKVVGTAPDAQIALFKTEDVSSETRIEEVYWLFAAEMADSLGVDVINSSLGYYEFDDELQNYKFDDLNGDKTIAARAADYAVGKGIIVVNSAGNEGNNSWNHIVTPADADSVLAVGAVDLSGNPVGFSSPGPNAKNAIKPEVSAKGSNTTVVTANVNSSLSSGTSFSSPLIAGMAASFKQAYPTLRAMQIRNILIESSSHYDAPDNKTGYGIPNFAKAAKLAQSLVLSTEIDNSEVRVFPNPIKSNDVFSIEVGSNYLEETKEVILSDILGREIVRSSLKSFKNKIPDLEPGIYFIKFQLNNINYSKRILKI